MKSQTTSDLRLPKPILEGMILARIESYRHILEMCELGCERLELIDYLKALIRSQLKFFPEDVNP